MSVDDSNGCDRVFSDIPFRSGNLDGLDFSIRAGAQTDPFSCRSTHPILNRLPEILANFFYGNCHARHLLLRDSVFAYSLAWQFREFVPNVLVSDRAGLS